jgi:hypothetical protein
MADTVNPGVAAGNSCESPAVSHWPPSRPGSLEVITVAACGVSGRAKLKQVSNHEFILAE